MEYKKSEYIISQRIVNDNILCSNSLSEKHIIIKENIFKLLQKNDIKSLQDIFPEIFERLKLGKFIIEKEIDEFSLIKNSMINEIKDKTLYHIIIYPTLDCNLSCWYCYENKIPNSKISSETINSIYKNIIQKFRKEPFSILKLSFFGGEPLLYPDIILDIIETIKKICCKFSIKLIFDFTTNGTLLTNSILESIKKYQCFFQITLDGNKKKHNKIKFSKTIKDPYSTTLDNIFLIQKIISNSFVSVRINFDYNTLSTIEEILIDLDELDRLRTKIILKKFGN